MRAVSVRGADALAACLIVALLAGCAGPATPLGQAPEGLAPDEITAGAYYAFHHAGGALAFRLDGEGDAAFDVYDGADQRLGSVGFSSGALGSGEHTIVGVAAGDLVLSVHTLNGTLRVQSGGAAVTAFHPLTATVERHALVVRAPRLDPLAGLVGVSFLPLAQPDPADETVAVALQRAPVDLRVLATGPAENLSVEVRSERGPVLQTNDPRFASGQGLSAEPLRTLTPLPADVSLQNLVDGHLTAHVAADDLAGVVLLESRTYSRARLPDPPAHGPAPGDVPFTYGTLPDGPVAFDVHRGTRALYAWQGNATPAGDVAYLALFDAADDRLATVAVPARGTARIPVLSSGAFVAVALQGTVVLGADEAPADFELHPLQTQERTAPTRRAGSSGTYNESQETVDVPHAFALRVGSLAAPDDGTGVPRPLGACDTQLRLRVDQGGESLMAATGPDGAEAPDATPFVHGSAALGTGPLVVTHDGFGDDGCSRLAVTVVGYVR